MSRSSSISTTRLIFELLKRIPRGTYITASELHRQLDNAGFTKTKRTIERHLDQLLIDFDIERNDDSKPYGYRWKSHAKGFSLPVLTQKESLLLALAKKYLENLLPYSVSRSMDDFFKQAETNLKKGEPEMQWFNKVRVVDQTQPLIPPPIKAEVFEAVSTALYENKWLNITYFKPPGYVADYHVMPLGLAQQGPRLYLVCRFQGYNNERSLALHRIQKAEVSGLSFNAPAASEFSLERYDNDGRFGFGEGKKTRLSFSIDKQAGFHLLESRLSEDQQCTEHDDSYCITATVVDTLQLRWWLNGFGDNVWNIQLQDI